MIVPEYYEDLSVLHDGTMMPRAYYVPASKRMNDPVECREDSDRMQMLNGNWKFRYYNSIYDVQDEFFALGYDTSKFDRVKVPGVWQMSGYDSHQYTNIRYPFPFDPPYIPQDIPCGAYVHSFDYKRDEEAPKAYLNFEGVDSCFYVWLNGSYTGYSQVSHAVSEFDITSKLVEGRNTIAVLVLKWCDGSYLEDQDKFRMSGIFRDVYLLKRPEESVRDYRVRTVLNENRAEANVSFSYLGHPVSTDVILYDHEDRCVASGRVKEDTVSLEVLNPVLWSPENPYLYTLVITTEGETITDYVGFRTIEIRDRILYFNGQKIKFNGVNRHDSDPVTGPVISIEQLMTDLKLMKQHNFNAIRSSHYPNAPYFYQLCDRYGFFVVDEADIEAHGPSEIYYKENTDQNKFSHWNERIADNPAWEIPILDRVRLMIERDKNRPCIVIWSMGNESAYGCNFEKALKWTKEFDPERITHYESARYRNPNRHYDYSHLDLYSRMYPALEEIEEYLQKDAGKPFLLVEYCHAMGNGPGDLEDYFTMIQENDIMCGGFVWEWCDHAIAHGKAENGKTKYYYGGDHGETIHDGNFCMDGLVYPDRIPHTGLLEYRNVYRPARVVAYDAAKGELKLHNYLDFTDLKDYVSIHYEVSCDGICTESGKITEFSVKPHEEAVIDLPVMIPDSGRVYLKLTYRLRKTSPLVPKGHMLGFDEVLLPNADGRNQTAIKWLNRTTDAARIDVQEKDDSAVCRGKDFAYAYNKRTGLFTSLNYAGREYLKRPMEINLFRAPTDNDRYIVSEWKRAHYHEAYSRAYETFIRQTKDAVIIISRMSVSAASVQRMMDIEAEWKIDCNGGIRCAMNVRRNNEFPELPRFGVRIFVKKTFEHVSYYGMGPIESYCDKHRASSHGLYRAKVMEMHEDYIRPQENGSHYDCDYVELSDGRYSFAVASEESFSFNVSPYTQEELECTTHHYQLRESDSTILCLDYAQNGIGSNSCGPKVLAPYRFDEEEFAFEWKLVPFVKCEKKF